MFPEVRIYNDPFEGLTVQLTELRGLIKIVPPLIEQDRERRWGEISARPSDGEDGDVIDVYEAEAGAEEGWGHARFDRTIYVAAVVTAWAVFHDYLARQLRKKVLDYDLSEHPPLAALQDEEVRAWDRQFDRLVKRYKDFADISLAKLPNWEHVLHAQELRNALVHNQGQYTRRYLAKPLARRPSKDDLYGMIPPADDALLIDRELIPLSETMVDELIQHLLIAATNVRDSIAEA